MDGSGDQGLPDARAAGVKLKLSSSSELEVDFGMHSHVAPVARFRDRVAQKRYTFYSGVSSMAKKSRFLIPHGVADQSRLPTSTNCAYEIYLCTHAIWMSLLRKNFRHLQPKSIATQAHTLSRKRDRCPLARARASTNRLESARHRRADPGSPAQRWRFRTRPPTIRSMNKPFRPRRRSPRSRGRRRSSRCRSAKAFRRTRTGRPLQRAPRPL